jgi:hypothetical protein
MLGLHHLYVSCVQVNLFLINLLLCSTYDGGALLDYLADALCPNFFPPDQECSLPLYPGYYAGGPVDLTLPVIAENIGRPPLPHLAEGGRGAIVWTTSPLVMNLIQMKKPISQSPLTVIQNFNFDKGSIDKRLKELSRETEIRFGDLDE